MWERKELSMTIEQAEKGIQAILKELEIDTEQLVEKLEIKEIDTTNINSKCKETIAAVRITMRPKIARRW